MALTNLSQEEMSFLSLPGDLMTLPLTPADGQSLRVAALLDQLVAALHHALQLSFVTGNTQEPGQLLHDCPQVLERRERRGGWQ